MHIFSISWWVSTFTATLITMVMIVIIKRMAKVSNIPIVSDMMSEV